eukprot:5850549-Pyramimonas_sp.AAC.1
MSHLFSKIRLREDMPDRSPGQKFFPGRQAGQDGPRMAFGSRFCQIIVQWERGTQRAPIHHQEPSRGLARCTRRPGRGQEDLHT